MGAPKKGMHWTGAPTQAVIMSLSKAALADVVVDLIRRMEGESTDGRLLAEAFIAAAEPTLTARGDRIPQVDLFWTGSAEWANSDPRRAEWYRVAREEWERGCGLRP